MFFTAEFSWLDYQAGLLMLLRQQLTWPGLSNTCVVKPCNMKMCSQHACSFCTAHVIPISKLFFLEVEYSRKMNLLSSFGFLLCINYVALSACRLLDVYLKKGSTSKLC